MMLQNPINIRKMAMFLPLRPYRILTLIIGKLKKPPVFYFVFFIASVILVPSKTHSQSWKEYDSLRVVHHLNQNFHQALIFGEKAVDLVKKEFGTNDTLYADMLLGMVHVLFNMGNFQEAARYTIKEMEVRKHTQGEDHYKYGICLNNLAFLFRNMGQYEKSLYYALEALENTEKSLGREHNIYATRLSHLGQIYRALGQYDKALTYYLESIEVTEKAVGKEHHDYGTRLSHLAALYTSLGQFEQALPLYHKVIEVTEKTLGKQHLWYGINLSNLGLLYYRMGQYEKALPYYIEALEQTEKTLGKGHPNYATNLNNLAGIYNNLGKNEEALALYYEAKDITAKAVGTEHPDYAGRLNNIAIIYYGMGQYESALPLYIEAVEIAEKNYGNNHPTVGTYLFNLANLKRNTNRPEEAFKYYKKAISINTNYIENVFSFLSESEKENFINTISENFDVYHSFFYSYNEENPAVGAVAYNVELATKGMILQSGIEMRQSILNSGDKALLEKYDEWLQVRTELSNQYSLPIDDRSEDLEKIEQKANSLEGELNRLSSAFRQVNTMTGMTWQDVQSKLQPDEIAIEFASFKYQTGGAATDSIMYVALLLGYNFEYPLVVPLFEEKEAEKILETSFENSIQYINTIYGRNDYRSEEAASLYNLIWKPLEVYLKNINTIYLSPNGLLHKISFAALSTTKNQYLTDIYNINLISGTSQIRGSDAADLSIQSIALFGGVDYNSESTQNEVWQYLEGSLIEVEILSEKLNNFGMETFLYVAKEAGEDAFKEVAGKTDILHIATHGFFYPDPEKVQQQKQQRITPGEVLFRGGEQGFGVSSFRDNANPLMRSGLAFAGANDVWNLGERIPGREDGVLTAHEVANMNLQNTELVVLSACETGLGDIRGSEGVYGLQRAFKMAGAKYLIMSLWQVPDKETVEFMETFYTKLFDYNDARKAFNKTQRQMRQKYDPFYWAAFVLVE